MDLLHKITSLRTSIQSRPPAEWASLASGHFPGYLNVLLVSAIAWYVSQLAWTLLPEEQDFDWSVRSPTPSSTLPSSTAGMQIDYPAIAGAHIFGVAGEDPVIVAETEVSDAPDTTLNLKLRGAIAADDPDFAHAIIADGQGNDDVYFLQDKVAGGAVLHEIHPDRVILNRAGKLEALRLPKLSESLGKQSAPSRSVSSSPARPPSSRANPARRSSGSGFMQVFRPQPFMPNGVLKGYRVYPGRDRRKFAELGFRPGDLVTAINGQQLNDLNEGPMDIFGDMDPSQSMSFTVERSGQPVVLTLDSSQLNSVTELD
ncbi:MAG: type II secretion system protein GspC [Gammaproteobacteria bacterium]